MSETKQRILIFEDNRVIADVLRFNLERADYEVTVACDGIQAMGILVDESFDLVITDHEMPGLRGEDLCRWLRTDGRHGGIPIVLCSARGFELDVKRLRDELDVSKVVFKPFSPRELVKLVAQLLETQPVGR